MAWSGILPLSMPIGVLLQWAVSLWAIWQTKEHKLKHDTFNLDNLFMSKYTLRGRDTLGDMLRGREEGTSGDKALLCVHIGRMFQGQYISWCTRSEIGSFLCCSGDSLQEQWTRYDTENWGHFCPCFMTHDFKPVEFMQHVVPLTELHPQKRSCDTRNNVDATCPRFMSSQMCPNVCRP